VKNQPRPPFSTVSALPVLLLVVGSSACASAGASEGTATPGPEADASEPREENAPSNAELEALFRARTDSALMEFTDADVRFMTGMIGHHAQALRMARLAPTHGASPTIQTLAARIINAQRDEIETMQRWLRQRGQPVPEVEASGVPAMADDTRGDDRSSDRQQADGRQAPEPQAGDETAMQIPGMLTAEQMRELDAARGREFDRLFLRYMIQHHRGAVVAVRELFATDGAARGDVTFKLASGIQVDQITEIERMELMLESMESR